jgi:hypothetical protein
MARFVFGGTLFSTLSSISFDFGLFFAEKGKSSYTRQNENSFFTTNWQHFFK